MSTKISDLTKLQANGSKQKVREIITKTALDFAKDEEVDIHLMSLPSTEWTFEKHFSEAAKKAGVKMASVQAVENGTDREGNAIFPLVKAAKPKLAGTRIYLAKKDFDKAMLDKVEKKGVTNFIWADYCGNPAKFKYFSQKRNLPRYSYPHIEAFVEVVKKAEHPLLYCMTFCCNGRIEGGRDSLKKAMSSGAKDMPAAIKAKINCTLSREGVTNEAQEICRMSYKGGKRSYMITFVFAVGFTPEIKNMKYDLKELIAEVPKKKEKKITDKQLFKLVKKDRALKKVEKLKASRLKDMQRKVIHHLTDEGFDSQEIADVLGVARGKVGATLAWYLNPDSFSK